MTLKGRLPCPSIQTPTSRHNSPFPNPLASNFYITNMASEQNTSDPLVDTAMAQSQQQTRKRKHFIPLGIPIPRPPPRRAPLTNTHIPSQKTTPK